MDTQQIVAALRQPPLVAIANAVRPEADGGAPAEPGFYSWWGSTDCVRDVPATPHPSEPVRLLYLGIAPSRATSSATLRSRLLRQHIGGNVGSSTFRLGLAALLWEASGWSPRLSASGKARLDHADNEALSAWQREHLRLRWVVVPEPWRYEPDVVRSMRPAMNREHNQTHTFYAEMGMARARFRPAAGGR